MISVSDSACNQPWPARLTSALLVSLVLSACGGGSDDETTPVAPDEGSTAWEWTLPEGFPTPKLPAGAVMTEPLVELGRFLFYEPRLSANGTQSCSSCHLQAKAFSEDLIVSVGSTGEDHPRNSQPLTNVVYTPTLTWANTALTTLELQMQLPLFGLDPVEMGIGVETRREVLSRFETDADYPARFALAFPDSATPISFPNITSAIAAFERTLISANSRYDQAQAGKITLSAAETRGQTLFFSEQAQCSSCHGSYNFNDQVVDADTVEVNNSFHNTGLYNIGGTNAYPFPNRGIYELTGQAADMGKFRAASLRNVEVTGPYMHDGSMATLEEIVAFYAAGGRNITTGPNAGDGRLNENKSELLDLISLSAQDQSDIVAFLKTLTDESFLTNPDFSDPFATDSP